MHADVPNTRPAMKQCELQVTYCKGKPFAANDYLSRERGDHSTRTADLGDGMLVDFALDGRAIGIEILSPSCFDLTRLNVALAQLRQPPVQTEELAPLVAAST